MSSKMKWLLGTYTLPFIMAVMISLLKGININGEESGYLVKFFVGFVFGMGIEGVLAILTMTAGIIFTNHFD